MTDFILVSIALVAGTMVLILLEWEDRVRDSDSPEDWHSYALGADQLANASTTRREASQPDDV